jgi:FMN phosphatase YigB (HAD superfamily)
VKTAMTPRQKKLIENSEVVSFDIFGTLLMRTCAAPEDVFDLVWARYSGLPYTDGSPFRSMRVNVCAELSKCQEPTLEEIYSSLDSFSDADKMQLKQLELDCEREVLFPRQLGKELYAECVRLQKRIFITSDMYLPSDVLEKLLRENGYDFFESILVSCEYRKTKQTGELFNVLLEKAAVPAGHILHIGDNFTADYKNALHSGFNALYIGDWDISNRLARKIGKQRTPDVSLPLFLTSRKPLDDDEKLGYQVLGPILYGFAHWLHDIGDDNKPFFFLARDSYLLRKAYLNLYPEADCHYLYLSRKSVTVPYLRSSSGLSSIADYVQLPRGPFSLGEFCEGLGIIEADWAELANRLHLPTDKLWTKQEFFASDAINDFYCQIEPMVKSNAAEQNNLLRRYLVESGVCDGAQLVDIGWHATIQKALEGNFGLNLHGFYLGTSGDSGISTRGYAYDEQAGLNMDLPLKFALFGGFFETFFYAPHGTTLGYQTVAGQIAPVLGYKEMGWAVARRCNLIQTGALEYVSQLASTSFERLMPYDSRAAMQALLRLGTRPTIIEVERFGGLPYLNYGEVSPLIPQKGTYRPKDNGSIALELRDSQWKTGLMKSRVKLPLPYDKIYEFGRNAVNCAKAIRQHGA